MAAKNHITLHGVDWRKLPSEWTRQLGLSPDGDQVVRVDVTLDVIAEREAKARAPMDEIKAAARTLQQLPDLNPAFTERDLYDQRGIPR